MFFKKLKNIISIGFSKDWRLIIHENENHKIKFTKKSIIIIPDVKNTKSIFLKTKIKFKKGWYLFCINHRGDNNRCFGTIRVGRKGFSQSRPMYPSRKRWRVVRVGRSNFINLELERIFNKIEILNLYLIPLFRFDAWRRIYLRIKKISQDNVFKKNIISKNWKIYNNLLYSQKRYKPLVNYNYWIENIEQKIFDSIVKSQINFTSLDYKKILMINSSKTIFVDNDSWVIPFTSGFVFSVYTLQIIKNTIDQNPLCSIIYSDEDCISNDGSRSNPNFKPAWNRELFWSNPDYSNLWIIRGYEWNKGLKNLIKNGNAINLYSIILEITSALNDLQSGNKILHLPLILLHKKINAKENLILPSEETAKSLYSHLKANKGKYGLCKEVISLPDNLGHKLLWEINDSNLMSILIPTKDKSEILENCINSIIKYDPKIKFEIIIIDNDSVEYKTIKYFNSLKKYSFIKIIREPGLFNYSSLNNKAYLKAKGNIILLLNNDTEFLYPGWGERLSSVALRKGVGCVGIKLIYDDWTIQHAGVTLGIGGVAGHSHKYFNHDAKGYENRLNFSQEISANTAACLALTNKNWERLNGLDEINLKVNYNDVDLCLRANQIGLRNIFLPDVIAIHHESKSRGKPFGKQLKEWKKEYNYMKKKWGKSLRNDPNYSQYLTLQEEDWSLSLRKSDIKPR